MPMLILPKAFPDHDVTDEICDSLANYSKLNMRVLANMLIPTIRKFGLERGHTFNVDLIDQVARELLSMKKVS